MSQYSEAETRAEFKSLEEFANSLRKGSLVHSKIVGVIGAISRELEAQRSETKNDVWSLKLHVTIGPVVGLRNISLNSSSTLNDVKSLVENQPQSAIVERIKVKRTGRAWTQFDSRPLSLCEIVNGDELLVECTAKAQKQFDKAITGLSRMEKCGVKLTSDLELLIAAVHCFILDQGFVSVMELPSTVPGFAPSLRGKLFVMWVPISYLLFFFRAFSRSSSSL